MGDATATKTGARADAAAFNDPSAGRFTLEEVQERLGRNNVVDFS